MEESITTAVPSLNARVKGVQYVTEGAKIEQYRGLQYARIRQRFAAPEPVDDWGGAEIEGRFHG